MPRKNKTPAVRTRLRDNQRQSRARQKQFVHDLQQRLQAYERQGVQATLDMQRAARTVALENRLLRDLLAHHGVSHDRVGHFLRSRLDAPDGTTPGAPLSPGPHASGTQQPSCPVANTKGTCRSPCSLSRKPSGFDSGVARSAVATSDVGVDASVPHEEPDAHDGDEESGVGLASPESPSSTEAPSTRSDAMPTMPSMETLCEAAAAIIAEVQGHNDKGLAFAALGCEVAAGCTVENLRIFDVIDRS
ncbi:hypothetical protein F5883DRAFT_721250 [Diaporthe sp. PMI_573]|nr:hypothetical protein F5883DRAFT_721250 [Diaporthaceae sp. PMI_573]